MKCAFTGPRPQSLPFRCDGDDPLYDDLTQRLIKAISDLCEQGVREYYCGMAIGADLLCGEIAASMKESYPDIILRAVIPFKGQPDLWGLEDKERYNRLLAQCDSSVCLHDDCKDEYCLENSRYMIDHADILLAVCDPENTELSDAVLYAQTKSKRVIFISPVISEEK
jgi:uncharacterized phage-like protein YoqJ